MQSDGLSVGAETWRRVKRPRTQTGLEPGHLVMGFDVGQIHMAKCTLQYDDSLRPPVRVVSWDIVNLESGTVAKSVENLAKVIRTAEADSADSWTANHIIIEQQDRVNIKMVAMSHALQATLLMHNDPEAYVGFSSSAKKFSVFDDMPGVRDQIVFTEPKGQTRAKCKKVRKQNSINIVRALFRAMPETDEHKAFLAKFNATPADQRDDLADALVYALAFIYKNEASLPKPKKHSKKPKADTKQRVLTFV